MKTLILAAGRGSRLGKLTDSCPKPMIHVAGRPILEHVIRNVTRAGLRDFTIHIGYLGAKIADYFGNGGDLGVNINYFTADSDSPEDVIIRYGELIDEDSFCCLCGDTILLSHQIADLVRTYSETQADAVFVVERGNGIARQLVEIQNGRVIGAARDCEGFLLTSNMILRRTFLRAFADETRNCADRSFSCATYPLAERFSLRVLDFDPLININHPSDLQTAHEQLTAQVLEEQDE